MLNSIASIKLQGANFESPTIIKLFDPVDEGKIKTIKATLLYGRNGTGKSTIAKAFRKVSGEVLPIIQEVSIKDKDENDIDINDDDKAKIYVFDEDYVYRNVRIQEDHLDTIIMLGQSVDLSEKIEELSHQMEEINKSLDEQSKLCNKYSDRTNPLSPFFYLDSIKRNLQGDDKWSGRERLIKGQKVNVPVRDETYKQFVDLSPVKTREELLNDYNNKIEILNQKQSGSMEIKQSVPEIPVLYFSYDDEQVRFLLGKKIEQPALSDREKYLLELSKTDGVVKLSDRLSYFKSDKTDICSFCLQPLSSQYKKDLIISIEKILSRAVEDHKKEIEKQKYKELDLDLTPFAKLEGCDSCCDLIRQINDQILRNNQDLQRKYDNPYEIIEIDVTSIKELIIKLNDALENLEKERDRYNLDALNTDDLKKCLIQINGGIAFYDIRENVILYNKYYHEMQEANEKKIELMNQQNAIKSEIESLEAKKRNVNIALDSINACLKYIFFSDDRLKIEYLDGVYKLFSRGKSVKPSDVSVGERNIIALSYFFTNIMENQEANATYNKEHLLVIDDPISSFDMENKIGIMSFLKYKLSRFLEDNQNTKVLLMTHDLSAFYDIHKFLKEIIDKCKNKGYIYPPKFNCFELSKGAIGVFQYKKRQEYTELLKIVYNYASEQSSEYDSVIGNIMRQVLEAFSTFEYKESIENVTRDDYILGLLKDPDYISYFENLMYRLLLHGGSHKEEEIKTMKDYRFFSLISETEKRRTAKDILCFMYLLNKEHVVIHLKELQNANETLKAWCEEVKRRAVAI